MEEGLDLLVSTAIWLFCFSFPSDKTLFLKDLQKGRGVGFNFFPIGFSVAVFYFSVGWSTCENCSPGGNMRSQYITAPTVALLLFLLWIQSSTGCNKALCASDVSKCLIQVRAVFPLFAFKHFWPVPWKRSSDTSKRYLMLNSGVFLKKLIMVSCTWKCRLTTALYVYVGFFFFF